MLSNVSPVCLAFFGNKPQAIEHSLVRGNLTLVNYLNFSSDSKYDLSTEKGLHFIFSVISWNCLKQKLCWMSACPYKLGTLWGCHKNSKCVIHPLTLWNGGNFVYLGQPVFNKKSSLVKIMVRPRSGIKPLSKQMIPQFGDTYMRHWGKWIKSPALFNMCIWLYQYLYFYLFVRALLENLSFWMTTFWVGIL